MYITNIKFHNVKGQELVVCLHCRKTIKLSELTTTKKTSKILDIHLLRTSDLIADLSEEVVFVSYLKSQTFPFIIS